MLKSKACREGISLCEHLITVILMRICVSSFKRQELTIGFKGKELEHRLTISTYTDTETG